MVRKEPMNRSHRTDFDDSPISTASGVLTHLTDAATTSEFYANWIALLCNGMRSAAAGLLLLADSKGTYLPAAIWPGPVDDVSRLAPPAEQAIATAVPVVRRADPSAVAGGSWTQIAQPIVIDGAVAGAVVVELREATSSGIALAQQQLVWSLGWPESMIRRQRTMESTDLSRERVVLSILAAADAHERFEATAISMANEAARQFQSDRVCIGMLSRRGIRMAAMSHSTRFDKRSNLVQDLEGAMQEAFDQHATVVFPSTESNARRINVAHALLAERQDAGAVVSVLLVAVGRPVGVMTLERATGATFDEAELTTLEMLASALGPLADLRYRQDRWLGGRLMGVARHGLTALFNKERPSARLAVAMALAAVVAVSVYPATFRISAKAILEGEVRRVSPAPIDGFIASAPVRAGDRVYAGEEIARLDDRDLQLERLKFEMEEKRLEHRRREAAAKHERAAMAILSAQIEQARTQLNLIDEKLRRTRITAPIDGFVVSGDLTQMIGAPVTQGQVLFEIAPLSSYRVALHVDERDIGFLSEGQRGQLLLTGLSAQKISIDVTRASAIAITDGGRNVFKVEGSIEAAGQALRPGMEGIAKIDVGQRPLAVIWLRPIIERLQLFVWSWTP
jgi:multidrug resistance efflux pump